MSAAAQSSWKPPDADRQPSAWSPPESDRTPAETGVVDRFSQRYTQQTGINDLLDIIRASNRYGTPQEVAARGEKAQTALGHLVTGLRDEPARVWSEIGGIGQSMLDPKQNTADMSMHMLGAVPMFGPGLQGFVHDVWAKKYPEAAADLAALGTLKYGPKALEAAEALPEAAQTARAAVSGAVKGGWEGGTGPTVLPIKVKGVQVAEIPGVPASIAGAVTGGGAGTLFGGPKLGIAGAIGGAAIPIVKGAVKGARAALADLEAARAAGATEAFPVPAEPAPGPITGPTDEALVHLYSVETDPLKRSALQAQLNDRGLMNKPAEPGAAPQVAPEANPYRDYSQNALQRVYALEQDATKRSLIEQAARDRNLTLLTREGRRATVTVPETGEVEARGPSLTQDDALMLRYLGETDPLAADAETIGIARKLAVDNPELLRRLRAGETEPIVAPPTPAEAAAPTTQAVSAPLPVPLQRMVDAARQTGDFTPQEQALADHVLQNVEPQAPAPSAPAAASTSTALKPGQYVQWEYQGRNQYPEPQKITGFTDDGKYAFVEGSRLAAPVEQLKVAQTPPEPPATPPAAPEAPAATQEPSAAPVVPEAPQTLQPAAAVEKLTDYVLGKKIASHHIDRFTPEYWQMIADDAGTAVPTSDEIAQIKANVAAKAVETPVQGEQVFETQKARIEESMTPPKETPPSPAGGGKPPMPAGIPSHYQWMYDLEGETPTGRAFLKDQRVADYLLSKKPPITPEEFAGMTLEEQNKLILEAPTKSGKGSHRAYKPKPEGEAVRSEGRWAHEGINDLVNTMRWRQAQTPEAAPAAPEAGPARHESWEPDYIEQQNAKLRERQLQAWDEMAVEKVKDAREQGRQYGEWSAESAQRHGSSQTAADYNAELEQDFQQFTHPRQLTSHWDKYTPERQAEIRAAFTEAYNSAKPAAIPTEGLENTPSAGKAGFEAEKAKPAPAKRTRRARPPITDFNRP